MNFKGRLLVVLLQIVNGVSLINMKTELKKFMNSSGNIYNVKVTMDNGETRVYDFFTKEEMQKFLEALNGKES